jgi:hypothetical protein
MSSFGDGLLPDVKNRKTKNKKQKKAVKDTRIVTNCKFGSRNKKYMKRIFF